MNTHSHTGIKITYNTFSQYYYIPFLDKWLSNFIHDCIDCQQNKHFNQKIQTAPTQSFSEHAPSFNYRISMDADHSRPPTPNFSDYPLRVDGITFYDPQNDPRFSILAERFIFNNDLLSHKRKETELKRLQTPNLELKFEVKVNFQGLNPHPIFHVSKIEHKTSPAPFEVVHIEVERDLTQPTITYGKIIFCNP